MAGNRLGNFLSLTQTTKLSPQQIQFIKLLQITTAELEARVQEEIEANPALEEGPDDEPLQAESDNTEGLDSAEDTSSQDDINLDDYLRDSDISGFAMNADGGGEDDDRERPLSSSSGLIDQLNTQLGYLPLNETQKAIGLQIIGSLDEDGYLRRSSYAISNDLAFGQNIIVEEDDVDAIVRMIQHFDPAGIAARDLRECLLLQLARRTSHSNALHLAILIVEDCFEEFTKRNFAKIKSKLHLDDDELLREAMAIISKLNPKPGESEGSSATAQYVVPDFTVFNNNGKLELSLNSRNAPELRISPSYAAMLRDYTKTAKTNKSVRDTLTFVKQKLDGAKWFIDAIRQRQHTLIVTMQAILDLQADFFLTGEDSSLRPMILKDIADRVGLDISTISRVASSKYVETEFGTYSLKYFFSEAIQTDSGEDVSNREVKAFLKQAIDNEDKRNPLSDDELVKLLTDQGYNIARRTVAKYREVLELPVARLRRQL